MFRPGRKSRANPAKIDEPAMSKGINTESDISAELQLGPTDQGMVRLFVTVGELEIPMDFTPEEAREIAEELRAAAEQADAMQKQKPGRRKKKPGNAKGGGNPR